MSEVPRAVVLATDLDGTFIPLDGNQQNRLDLQTLCGELEDRCIALVYVTGRHLELVREAIRTSGLPSPPWIICDVGTSIFQQLAPGQHTLMDTYAEHLDGVVGAVNTEVMADMLAGVSGARLQEQEKQGRFKLSYYCDAGQMYEVVQRIDAVINHRHAPYHIISSVDPFTGEGLIDLLPRSVTKAYALDWWVLHEGYACEAVIFAGDSGNDLAALTAGYRGIIVGNAPDHVWQKARIAHAAAQWKGRLYRAKSPATSGVLEGLRHFLGEGA